jgi:hypothetical protein
LWIQWLLGDTVNEVPPLKMLNGPDVAHLDAVPIPAGSRRRKDEECCQMTGSAEWPMLDSVNAMFQTVSNHFIIKGDSARHIRRTEHLRWQTYDGNFRRLHP